MNCLRKKERKKEPNSLKLLKKYLILCGKRNKSEKWYWFSCLKQGSKMNDFCQGFKGSNQRNTSTHSLSWIPPPRFLGSCIWLLFFIKHDYEVSYHFFQPCQNSRSTTFSAVPCFVVIFTTTDAICIDKSKRPSFHLSCCVGSCGAWGSWGSCSKTCGSGFKLRERKCPENSLHLEKQKTSCNTNLCPGQRKEA